jgi:hypothetical protein
MLFHSKYPGGRNRGEALPRKAIERRVENN